MFQKICLWKRIVLAAFVKKKKNHLLLQTYGLQLRDSSAVEMCTFVCKVQEDSAAESAGLTTGESPTSFRWALHMLSYTYKTIRP